MSAAARAGLAAVAVALALGASGCVAVTAPASAPATAPPGPMMGQGGGASGDADDGYGGMMGGTPTAVPAVPHSGPVAGETLTPAAVAALQQAVDQGTQPWRLDPQMTAVAFTRARFGWMMPRPERTAADTVVVDDGAGGAVALRMVQPGRTGPDAIWTVAGGTWLR